MDTATTNAVRATPWNKGKLVGQKPPLKLKEIWAIRIRLQLDHRARELALFNLAIDSKLRGCDLLGLRVHDVIQGSSVMSLPGRSSCRKRRSGRCNLRSPSNRGNQLPLGSRRRIGNRSSSSFQVGCQNHLIYRPGSIPGSSGPGWNRLDLTRQPTARIQCGAPNPR